VTARASNVQHGERVQLFVLEPAADRGSLSVDWLAFFQKYEKSDGGKAAKRVSARRF
jgi:hypothetical protein